MKRIEYLIIIKKNGDFCADKESFIRFLQVDPQIKIESEDVLKHHNHSFKFTIGEKQDVKNGFIYYEFNIEFKENIPEKEVVSLTKILKTNILKIDKTTQIKLLWDDFNVTYNTKAYPILNNLENLMRKLISKFMILNVGVDWFTNNTAEDIQKNRRERVSDDLFFDEVFKIDFIDLKNVLFTPYRKMKLTEVDNLIRDIPDNDDRKLALIKDFSPISNWTRYFKSIVKQDEKKITDAWTKLYDIRNDIAHNRFINQSRFEELNQINKEIEPILNEALKALNIINLTSEDRETIISTRNDQAFIRLIKVAKTVNESCSTLANYLNSIGHTVEPNPNIKITEEQYELLLKKFRSKDSYYSEFYKQIIESPSGEIYLEDLEKLRKYYRRE